MGTVRVLLTYEAALPPWDHQQGRPTEVVLYWHCTTSALPPSKVLIQFCSMRIRMPLSVVVPSAIQFATAPTLERVGYHVNMQESSNDSDGLGDESDELYLAGLERALKDGTGALGSSAAEQSSLRIFNLPPLGLSSLSAKRRSRRKLGSQLSREDLQLFNIPRTFRSAYDDLLERPGQPLLLGSLALLFGFYLAGALSTIFGAAGFWEPTIALGPLICGELITRRYYSRPMSSRSQTIRLLNALKVGFYFGVTLDALKLAG